MSTPRATCAVGTVLVHPDDDLDDPDALRLIKLAVTPGAWPWHRLTGLPTRVPRLGTNLDEWQRQPLGDIALLLHHPVVISGHEVSR